MTIQELRQPKLHEIAEKIKRHQYVDGCSAQNQNDIGEFIAGACSCVPDRMFLYDLIYHEPSENELAACNNGAPVPEFLRVEK